MKIALIYNYPLHYREAIFHLLDKKYNVDFYFGDKLSENIKKFNFNKLNGKTRLLKNYIVNNRVYWRKGIMRVAFGKYDKYLILGEFHNISIWLLLMILKIRKKKVYSWTHGWYGKEGFLLTKIKKIFFNLNTGVFVYGNYAKNLMIKVGIDHNKIHVIYNSLDYEKQMHCRSNLQQTDIYKKYFKNDYPVIIFTGRLTGVKNIGLLIDAHALMEDKKNNFNVVVVGDGPERNNLEKKVKDNFLTEKYWFYGETYKEELISELYYNATVCVSPGNVGLTAMHAMVYGCPVITHSDYTTQMPEFEVIEDGVTGLFFKKDNPIDLGEKIYEWIEHSKKKRECIRELCYMKIDNYYNPINQIKVFNEIL